jgi:CubicO group peptidase (beta-lactamase class C family)
VADDRFSGVVLAQRSGTTVFERVQGLADHDRREACARGTRFQIASVSKQFTAAAVLLLAGPGLISLQDRLERWLGTCPPPWRPITVHQLLTHTAGLGHWAAYPGVDHYRPVPAAQLLARFTRVPLLSPPGERYSYSGPGYVLLAWIVEQVSGQPYASFLAETIFGPLGLRSAAVDVTAGPGVARGYRGRTPEPPIAPKMGTGDIWCSAEDLLRWDRALAAGALLTPALDRAMLTAHVPAQAPADLGDAWSTDGYGYGWHVGTAAGRRAYFHSGGNPGYRAVNAWLPDDDVRIALCGNDEAADFGQILTQALREALAL